MLIKSVPKLKYVIDLTCTTKYYNYSVSINVKSLFFIECIRLFIYFFFILNFLVDLEILIAKNNHFYYNGLLKIYELNNNCM
jgi:hypothetical protein